MPSLAESKVKLRIGTGHSLTCLHRMESKHSDWRTEKLQVPQIVGVILQGVRQEWGTGGALHGEDGFTKGPYRCVLGTSRVVVYGKWAKKKANVTSYFLMISEWHP